MCLHVGGVFQLMHDLSREGEEGGWWGERWRAREMQEEERMERAIVMVTGGHLSVCWIWPTGAYGGLGLLTRFSPHRCRLSLSLFFFLLFNSLLLPILS